MEGVRVGGEGRFGSVGGAAPHPDRATGAVHGEDVVADPQLVAAVDGRRVGGPLERDQERVQAPPGVLWERGAGSPLAEVDDDGLQFAPQPVSS
jgi:hypothetical protein